MCLPFYTFPQRSPCSELPSLRAPCLLTHQPSIHPDPQESEIPFGACVWATGVAMHPVVRIMQEKLPAGTQVGGNG